MSCGRFGMKCSRFGFGPSTWRGGGRWGQPLPRGWTWHHWQYPRWMEGSLGRFVNGQWNRIPLPGGLNGVLGSGKLFWSSSLFLSTAIGGALKSMGASVGAFLGF